MISAFLLYAETLRLRFRYPLSRETKKSGGSVKTLSLTTYQMPAISVGGSALPFSTPAAFDQSLSPVALDDAARYELAESAADSRIMHDTAFALPKLFAAGSTGDAPPPSGSNGVGGMGIAGGGGADDPKGIKHLSTLTFLATVSATDASKVTATVDEYLGYLDDDAARLTYLGMFVNLMGAANPQIFRFGYAGCIELLHHIASRIEGIVDGRDVDADDANFALSTTLARTLLMSYRSEAELMMGGGITKELSLMVTNVQIVYAIHGRLRRLSREEARLTPATLNRAIAPILLHLDTAAIRYEKLSEEGKAIEARARFDEVVSLYSIDGDAVNWALDVLRSHLNGKFSEISDDHFERERLSMENLSQIIDLGLMVMPHSPRLFEMAAEVFMQLGFTEIAHKLQMMSVHWNEQLGNIGLAPKEEGWDIN